MAVLKEDTALVAMVEEVQRAMVVQVKAATEVLVATTSLLLTWAELEAMELHMLAHLVLVGMAAVAVAAGMEPDTLLHRLHMGVSRWAADMEQHHHHTEQDTAQEQRDTGHILEQQVEQELVVLAARTLVVDMAAVRMAGWVEAPLSVAEEDLQVVEEAMEHQELGDMEGRVVEDLEAAWEEQVAMEPVDVAQEELAQRLVVMEREEDMVAVDLEAHLQQHFVGRRQEEVAFEEEAQEAALEGLEEEALGELLAAAMEVQLEDLAALQVLFAPLQPDLEEDSRRRIGRSVSWNDRWIWRSWRWWWCRWRLWSWRRSGQCGRNGNGPRGRVGQWIWHRWIRWRILGNGRLLWQPWRAWNEPWRYDDARVSHM